MSTSKVLLLNIINSYRYATLFKLNDEMLAVGDIVQVNEAERELLPPTTARVVGYI